MTHFRVQGEGRGWACDLMLADASWCWRLCDWSAAAADWEAATTASCTEGCWGVCIFSLTDDLRCSAGGWARPGRSPPGRKTQKYHTNISSRTCVFQRRMKIPKVEQQFASGNITHLHGETQKEVECCQGQQQHFKIHVLEVEQFQHFTDERAG